MSSGSSTEDRPARLRRYLPLVLLATASVVVAPALIVAAIVPRGGIPTLALSVLATVAVSLLIATVESALWSRLSRAQDLTFAELMLWGWLRRCWAERGLAAQRELYEAARKIGPAVSVDQLERLSMMLQARDSYTHGHSRRVARHAARIARSMRLPGTEVAKIRTAAVVHDVGKIYTPKEILRNPGRLTDAEFEIVKRHAADGAGMLAIVGSPEIAAMVRHHHERIDGSGYPDGLAGEQIPLGARIIAVADTFDALTSDRPYRDANSHRRALRIIGAEAGAQLDAAAVAAFLGRYSSRRSVASFSFLAALPGRILAALQAAGGTLGAGSSGAASLLPALGASGLLGLAAAPAHVVQAARASHAGHRVTVGEVGGAGFGQALSAQGGSSSDGPGAGAGQRKTAHHGHRHAAPGPQPSRTPSRTQTSTSQTPTSPSAEGRAGAPKPAAVAVSAPGASQPPPSSSSGSPSTPAPEPEPAPSEGPSSSPQTPSQTVSGVVAGTTAAVGAGAGTALSGTTQTLSSTTEALTGPDAVGEATGALVGGATTTVTETTTSLISNVAKGL
jgi:putative nucleotidyltransferase with HDIG domain